MNSDSGSPFLGLQLSVDASDAQPDAEKVAVQLVSNEPNESVVTLNAKTARAQSPEWATVSVRAAPSKPGVLANPLATVEADEDPFTAVGRRLAAF